LDPEAKAGTGMGHNGDGVGLTLPQVAATELNESERMSDNEEETNGEDKGINMAERNQRVIQSRSL